MEVKVVGFAEQVFESWRTRRCFICEAFGVCRHREFDVEAAILLARIDPAAAPPPAWNIEKEFAARKREAAR